MEESNFQGYIVGDFVSVYWGDKLEAEGHIKKAYPDGVAVDKGDGQGWYILTGSPVSVKYAGEQINLF